MRYSIIYVVDLPSVVFKIVSNGFWFLKCLDNFTVVILCFVLIVWSFRFVKNTPVFDRQRFSVVNRNDENNDFGKYCWEHCQQNGRWQGKLFGRNTIGRSLRYAKCYIMFQMANKRGGTRKFLQTLQPSGGDKENLVGLGRSKENAYAHIFRFVLIINRNIVFVLFVQ